LQLHICQSCGLMIASGTQKRRSPFILWELLTCGNCGLSYRLNMGRSKLPNPFARYDDAIIHARRDSPKYHLYEQLTNKGLPVLDAVRVVSKLHSQPEYRRLVSRQLRELRHELGKIHHLTVGELTEICDTFRRPSPILYATSREPFTTQYANYIDLASIDWYPFINPDFFIKLELPPDCLSKQDILSSATCICCNQTGKIAQHASMKKCPRCTQPNLITVRSYK